MAEVKKTVLIEFTPQQMFDLVDRCEDYPDFLPWCGGSEVHERDEIHTVATIRVNYHGIRSHFTTRNRKYPPHEMHIELEDGPFRKLDGTWCFIALGEGACKIEFRLHYEFSNRLLDKALGPVFNRIANTFVESFVKRANQVYRKD